MEMHSNKLESKDLRGIKPIASMAEAEAFLMGLVNYEMKPPPATPHNRPLPAGVIPEEGRTQPYYIPIPRVAGRPGLRVARGVPPAGKRYCR